MAMKFDQNYWERRWQEGRTQWDVGEATPPITTYFKNAPSPDAKILIPGCGSAYEAKFLHDIGCKNVDVLEIAHDKVEELRTNFRDTSINVIHADFFQHTGEYDIIIEQTFFCALDPKLRKAYAEKMQDLLKPEGTLVGVLFNRTFGKDEPPFGGSIEEYFELFNPYFSEVKLEACYNSIPQRAGRELFIKLQK